MAKSCYTLRQSARQVPTTRRSQLHIEASMLFSRRLLLSLVPALATAEAARADTDPTRAERFVGKPDAKTTVHEYFSLTCTHCAAFAQGTFLEIKEKLIDPGTVRWVFHDYPLDQVALTAAMV